MPAQILILHTPYYFSYTYLSGQNLWSSIKYFFFGWSWVYLGLCVHFYSYKWTQRHCLLFFVFIHPNSHVNRATGERAFGATVDQDALGQGYSTEDLVLVTGPSGRALSNCKQALTLAFTASNSVNRKPPKWRQQPSAGCSLSLTANWLSLWPSLPPADSTAAGICIYYFIMPSYFRLDHMIFFRLLTQVHLWLTAWSRVNM